MAKYWLGVVLALGVHAPGLAAAQAPTREAPEGCGAPSSASTEAAKQAFRDGQAAFSEGDVQRAAERWQSAYDLDCTAHALLLNLATAQELLGRPDMAAHTLQLFNDRAPDSPYAEANRRRIARLQRMDTSPIRPRREPQRPCPVAPATPTREAGSSAGLSFPIALALGGGLAAVLGGTFYAEARVAASNAAEACGGAPGECTSRNAVSFGERARARAEASGWIASIGILTLASGMVWELLSSHGAMAENGSASSLRLGSRFTSDALRLELAGGF